MKIVIFGYYHKQNLGDDLFQYVLTSWFESFDITIQYKFINPHEIDEMPEADILLIGGGDLVNNYFIHRIKLLTRNFTNPIYGIGLGFPYPNLITKEYLDLFDFISTRTSSAIPQLKSILSDRIRSDPDLVRDCIPTSLAPPLSSKTVGVFLASSTVHMPIHERDPILLGYANLFAKLLEHDPELQFHLYAMNTNNTKENDDILNEEIAELVPVKFMRKIIKVEEAAELFSTFSYVICTRFHAHILAINAGVPFLSIYSTSKVEDLLQSESLFEYAEKMTVDPKTLMPTHLNVASAVEKFKLLLDNKKEINRKLIQKRNRSSKALIETKQYLQNLLFYKPRFRNISLQVNEIYESVKNSNFLTEAVTFAITRKEEANFTWGLRENLEKGADLREAIKWILQHTSKEMPYMNSFVPIHQRKYNLEYFNQDILQGVHRNGWQTVVDTLKMYHNPNGVIFDSYLDKTFGWSAHNYHKIGVLPLKQRWTGIFHHLPSEEYDKNNLTVIMRSPLFIQSLEYCEGLIVLSTYLKEWLERNLPIKVPVKMVFHPIPPFEKMWSSTKFKNNEEKKVVQIGGWMRNTFAIVDLPELRYFKKAILKGKKMNGYYPGENFIHQLIEKLSGISTIGGSQTGSAPTLCHHETNKFLIGFLNSIENKLKMIQFIDTLSNDQYDDLITSNVIFINLIDASACNTIIEAIRANTPILVNRLPATEEYLGHDYPGLYDTLEEASAILNSEHMIYKMHDYLKSKDKNFLNMNFFIQSLFS